MKQSKNIFILALVAIIIFLLFKYCNGSRDVVVKETIKYDTTWVTVKGDTVYQPQNDTIYYAKDKIRFRWDTLYLEKMKHDSAITPDIFTRQTIEDYFATRTYKDTIKNQYGKIILLDTVSQNRIQGRNVQTDLKIPEVTKTIERTILDKRIQLYAEFSLLGNTKDLASGVDVGLSLKTKNDRMVGIGYETLFNGGNYWKIKYAHKLSFKRK